VHFVKSR